MRIKELALVGIFIIGTLTTCPVANEMALAQSAPQLPNPPRFFVDTTYRPPSGRMIAVPAGGNVQAALNAAQPGDAVTLEAGATFTGNFTLPKKSGTGWIVIRTSAPDSSLPQPGTRVTPAHTAAMPKLVSPNGVPTVQTAPGAHHYRFVGVEFTVASNVKTIYSIVALGGDQRSLADTPEYLILDRCYVHGQPTVNTFRGVLLNSAFAAVVDSNVSEIHVNGFDSQAILGINGPGPFKIVNNYLEGAGENIMFGGGDPAIPGLVPSDIEIRRNHLFKPLAWQRGQANFAGTQWTIKNLLELKNAQRVHIEGNVLENVWEQGQTGGALVLTPRNQDGTAPWTIVQDVLFRNNIVKNAAHGFRGQSTDEGHPSQSMKRIAIVNNLWVAIGRFFFGIAAGPIPIEDLVVDHNTAIPCGYLAYRVEGGAPPALTRFHLTNNLLGFGAYGISFSKADDALARWAPGAVIAKNALVSLGDVGDGQGATRNQQRTVDAAMYIALPSAAAAGLNPDGTLTAAKGPLKGAGMDGKDIGANLTAIADAMKP